jgi:hypothetical protein
LAAGAAVFVYLHPVILKVPAGSARVLSPPLDSAVKVDGEERPAARVFAMKTSFHGQPIDSLVLWIPEQSAISGRAIIIIDRMNRDVGTPPNFSDMDYCLLWGRYLFQSEGGSRNSLFAKGERYEDPELVFENGTIKFKVHTMSPYLAGRRIEVNLQTPAV